MVSALLSLFLQKFPEFYGFFLSFQRRIRNKGKQTSPSFSIFHSLSPHPSSELRRFSINIHHVKHLKGQVLRYGPLWTTSCFPFESMNHFLRKLIHGTGNVLSQVPSSSSFLSLLVMKESKKEKPKLVNSSLLLHGAKRALQSANIIESQVFLEVANSLGFHQITRPYAYPRFSSFLFLPFITPFLLSFLPSLLSLLPSPLPVRSSSFLVSFLLIFVIFELNLKYQTIFLPHLFFYDLFRLNLKYQTPVGGLILIGKPLKTNPTLQIALEEKGLLGTYNRCWIKGFTIKGATFKRNKVRDDSIILFTQGNSRKFGRVHAVHHTEQGIYFSVFPFRRVNGNPFPGPCPFNDLSVIEAFFLCQTWATEVLPNP